MENQPCRYAIKKSAGIVVELVKRQLPVDARILELGCNMGLTLRCLWEAGYLDMTGVEINPVAIDYMRKFWPEMQIPIYEGTIEESIGKLAEYDLIFSKAVLCHVHHDGAWIFPEMVKRTRFIVTIEDERSRTSGRHFPRNYQEVFEELGVEQIEYIEEVPNMRAPYRARMFVKR